MRTRYKRKVNKMFRMRGVTILSLLGAAICFSANLSAQEACYRSNECPGALVCMESFGASGPAKQVYEKFGITTENVVKKTLELVK